MGQDCSPHRAPALLGTGWGSHLHSPPSPWVWDTPGMSLALRGKLKGSAGSAGVKGTGWWLWLGALRCWLWKGSFSHWDFYHVPTVGASQPRRKGSLQRSSEQGAEQADPCTGLDYGVIHHQVLLWETKPQGFLPHQCPRTAPASPQPLHTRARAWLSPWAFGSQSQAWPGRHSLEQAGGSASLRRDRDAQVG